MFGATQFEQNTFYRDFFSCRTVSSPPLPAVKFENQPLLFEKSSEAVRAILQLRR